MISADLGKQLESYIQQLVDQVATARKAKACDWFRAVKRDWPLWMLQSCAASPMRTPVELSRPAMCSTVSTQNTVQWLTKPKIPHDP